MRWVRSLKFHYNAGLPGYLEGAFAALSLTPRRVPLSSTIYLTKGGRVTKLIYTAPATLKRYGAVAGVSGGTLALSQCKKASTASAARLAP